MKTKQAEEVDEELGEVDVVEEDIVSTELLWNAINVTN
jgi:hypothetical protein